MCTPSVGTHRTGAHSLRMPSLSGNAELAITSKLLPNSANEIISAPNCPSKRCDLTLSRERSIFLKSKKANEIFHDRCVPMPGGQLRRRRLVHSMNFIERVLWTFLRHCNSPKSYLVCLLAEHWSSNGRTLANDIRSHSLHSPLNARVLSSFVFAFLRFFKFDIVLLFNTLRALMRLFNFCSDQSRAISNSFH